MLPVPPVDDLLRGADPGLFVKYSVIKSQLLQNVQTRWCGRWVEGNDHGPGHIERVLGYLAAILGPDPLGQGRLNAFELFLAATAVVAHDLGVIDGRDRHAERSTELLKIIAATNDLLFDEHFLRVLGAAIVCHSSHVDIEVGCQGLSFTETFVGHEVRPRFVAALVRLADELDEDRRRAERWVQGIAKVPAASRPYWEFCQRIQGIGLDESSITFHVVFRPEDAGRLVVPAGGSSETFLRFFAKKVAKINRERERARPYLHELSRRRLAVSVKPLDGASGWRTPRDVVFPDGSCMSPEAERDAVERFVQTFPELERGTPPNGPVLRPAMTASAVMSAVVRSPEGETEGNAFVVGPPIADPRRFFGRADVVKRLFGLWRGPPLQNPLQNAAIIGPARSGKTSLLRHLLHLAISSSDALRPDQREQCPARVRSHRWAFVDFQDPRMGDPEGLLRHLLSQLGIPAPEPCTLVSFYDAVEKGLSTPSVVLLDELGVALTRYPALDDTFWESLRSLATAVQGKLGFVLAAHESPYALAESAGKTSPFFNTFGFTKRLVPLSVEEARQLVQSAPVPFAEGDVEWIVGTSGRWPILLQALCRERLAALEDGDRGEGWREEGLRQMEPYRFLLEVT